MRLRELIYMLGLKPNYRFYPYQVEDHRLDDEVIQYARWSAPNHPSLAGLQEEVDELRRFIEPGDFAIDVGAHVGDSTLPIALACGGTGLVAAFEPNPMTYAVLGANAALNPGRTNIFPLPFAASADDCTLTFDYGDPWLSNGGDHAGVSKWRHGSAFSIPVQGTNVERLVRRKFGDFVPRLRYVKIDVEGHDFMVLQSMKSLVLECRPHIKMEIGRPTSITDRQGIRAFFQQAGYELFLVTDRKRLFGAALTDLDLFGRKTIDVFASPLH